MNKYFIFFISILLIGCVTKQPIISNAVDYKVSKDLKKVWWQKDIQKDSIPGISLERAYQELIKNKKGKEIIVAVIDTQMDINHEDLKQAIWVNKDEIPNNNIDDDHNEYIDDIHGWNFIGNSKGESVYNSNLEFIRVIRKYKEIFENKSLDSIKNELKSDFQLYKQAKLSQKKEIENVQNLNSSLDYSIKWLDSIKKILKPYSHNKPFTIKLLDSINTKDKKILSAINDMRYAIDNGWSIESFIKRKKDNEERYLKYYLNIDYNDRKLIGDNENNLKDVNYGYHNVAINQKFKIYHSTYVTGVLAANRNNIIGIKGISANIRIMPLVISSNGDENDKDVALAIRYAVDNGAKVINMSFAKEFSLHKKWVENTIKYADKKNVLLVHGAGNDNDNNDITYNYPIDYDINGKEIVNNFIEVSSSTYKANNKLVSFFTSFGKRNVDIFAPGQDIYTTRLNNEYKYMDGTSMATPMVSGVAALIMSYYPKLKASEVKEIILTSGVSYDIDVRVKDNKGKRKLLPFKSLSKSGKVLNAYNALLYAKNYKKWKTGKWPKNN